MKLVVGLGNPGRRYEGTRHNVGFDVVRRVAERARIAWAEEAFEGRVGRGTVAGETAVLLLPGTWMNVSGDAVVAALDALPEVDPGRDLLVVLDDADLPLGRLRLRARGSDGGHRGLRDVLECLARRDLPRLRFGIGRPGDTGSDAAAGSSGAVETADFVLRRFEPGERTVVDEALERAAAAVEHFCRAGIEAAMNAFNAPPRAEARAGD